MFKIVIVDDEQWIRRWLEKMIRELRDDLKIIGSFEDGEEACEFLKYNTVDIVITDIRMPIMTGLELAEYADQNNIDTKFIMISGYEEFEYAKRALQLHALGYLLKPLEKEELKAVLDFAVETLSVKGKKTTNQEDEQLVVSRLLRKLVNNQEGELDYILNELHMYHNLLIGSIQKDMVVDANKEVEDALRDLLKGIVPSSEVYVVKEAHFNYFYFILSKDIGEMHPNARYIKQKVSEEIEGVKVFQGNWFEKPERLFLELTYVRTLMKANDRKSIDKPESNIGRTLIILRSNIVINTRTRDYQAVEKCIGQLKEYYLSHDVESESFRHMLFALMNDIIKLLESGGLDEKREAFISKGYDFCVRINKYDNVTAMLEWASGYLREVIEYLEKGEEYSVADIVKKECGYMREHYSEDINLNSVCEKYGINSSYYSKKFKEEVGMSFVDYLTNIRMDVAKKLLINTEVSVKKIASSVGYNDSKYFSRVFQSSVGCSPSTYRANEKDK